MFIIDEFQLYARKVIVLAAERERERERETDRQTDRQTDRHTYRQRDRERQRERDVYFLSTSVRLWTSTKRTRGQSHVDACGQRGGVQKSDFLVDVRNG